MARPVRKIVGAVVAVVLVAGLAYALRPQPVPVDVAMVVRGPLRVTVDEDGKTRIKERYTVSAPVFGQVHRLTLKAGDTVEAGRTVLAVIDPVDPTLLDMRERATAQARLRGAEASVFGAQARAEKVRAANALDVKNLTRARQLGTSGGMSKEDLDRIEHTEWASREEKRAAEFAVRVAEYEREMARAALRQGPTLPSAEGEPYQFDVRSPIDGRVLHVFQESTAVISAGTRLLEIGDPADLEVEIDVLSRDAVRIAPGSRVELEQWGGEGLLRGRVRLVEPAGFLKVSALGIEEQRVNVVVDLTDPPASRGRLGDAFRVEARIIVWESADVLKVPAGALFRSGDGWAVFVVEGGKVRLRPVKAGHSNGLETEILGGVEEGTSVVLHPSDRIQDETTVAPR